MHLNTYLFGLDDLISGNRVKDYVRQQEQEAAGYIVYRRILSWAAAMLTATAEGPTLDRMPLPLIHVDVQFKASENTSDTTWKYKFGLCGPRKQSRC